MKALKSHSKFLFWIMAFVLLFSMSLALKAEAAEPLYEPHPYAIRPMLTCTVQNLPLSLHTYMRNFGKFVEAAAGFFYIEGISGHHIIVDTGQPATTFKQHGFQATQVATTEERLAELGLKPSDIDMVILTHLHFDHVENLKLFKTAKVVVQKTELQAANNPPISQAGFYDPKFWKGIDFTVVDGDVELFPGLWVLYTPGHSVGTQSVLVDAEGGRYIILGLCCLDVVVEKELVPGIHTNAETAYRSMMKIKNMADRVITVHDTNTFKKEVYK
jgi:glyoxylase-like metal-dependent hydrolase (beta-lactamase superfamily II)